MNEISVSLTFFTHASSAAAATNIFDLDFLPNRLQKKKDKLITFPKQIRKQLTKTNNFSNNNKQKSK